MQEVERLTNNVDALIRTCQKLQNENETLKKKIAEMQNKLDNDFTEIMQLRETNRTIRTANALLGNETDRTFLRNRINQMIKKLNTALNVLKM